MHNAQRAFAYVVQGGGALGTTYCVASHIEQKGEQPIRLDYYIRYDDELVREEGRWLFMTRRFKMQFIARMPVQDVSRTAGPESPKLPFRIIGARVEMNAEAEIEAIRQLKYRYFRLLDQKKHDDLANLMVPECTMAYHNGRDGFPDRKSFIEWVRVVSQPYVSMHHGHHPEITLLSADEARGVWYLHDVFLNLEEKWRGEGNGFYDDRYRKVGGEWKIAHTGYRRSFLLRQPLGEVQSLYNGFEEGPF